MSGFKGLRRVLRLAGREAQRVREDFDDEVGFHIDMRIAELIANGRSPEAAREEALRRFGDVRDARMYCEAQDIERVRAVERRNWLVGLGQDLRYAMRSFGRTPAFTATAILTLALGIGANTAIFSVVNRLVLKPFPYHEPDRLAMLWTAVQGSKALVTAERDVAEAWARRARSLEAVSSFQTKEYVLGGEETELVAGASIAADLPALLGTQPELGRGFAPDETRPGGPKVVMIGYGLWKRRFAGQRDVLGRTLILDGEPHTIVGVMKRDFDVPMPSSADLRELWTPHIVGDTTEPAMSIARLRDGFTVAQAERELTTIAATVRTDVRGLRSGDAKLIAIAGVGRDANNRVVVILFGAVGLVLLIACANVANLFLARATVRQRELAVRAAIGAGRWRLVRQLLAESTLLAIVSGSLGLWLAWRGLDLIVAVRPSALRELDQARIEPIVLAWTLGVSLLTGLLFGLVPALQLTGRQLADMLKAGASTTSPSSAARQLRAGLVSVEVALSVVLLIGAGLLFRTMMHLQRTDLGFETEGRLSISILAPTTAYPVSASKRELTTALVDATRRVPGVIAATAAHGAPLDGSVTFGTFEIEGSSTADEPGIIGLGIVDQNYFATIGMRVLEGRGFSSDTSGSPTIISRGLAQKYWGTHSPIGRRFRLSKNGDWHTVIGVVNDVRRPDPADGIDNLKLYYPTVGSMDGSQFAILVHGGPEIAAQTPLLRRAIAGVDPRLAVRNVRTFEEMARGTIARQRFAMALLSGFAALALVLSAIGLYSVISFAVTQRTREIGVRMALGARPRSVVALIVRQGMLMTLLGLVLGLGGAVAVTRVMRSLLYEVSPLDPITFVIVAATLPAIALLATWLPARRATRVDPTLTLRSE